MIKLKQLKEIQGNIAKKEFLAQNKTDKQFIECLKFLLDDLIITNISRKKYDKLIHRDSTNVINSVEELLEYLKKSTGKDVDLVNIKSFVNRYTGDEKEILEGLVCKDYTVNFGIKFYNEVMEDKILESPYLGCQPFSEDKVKKIFENNKKAISQCKNDGAFVNLIAKSDIINFTGRSGLPFYINGKLIDDVRKIRKEADYDFVLTGEILIKGFSRMIANGIIRGLISSNEKILNGDIKEAEKFKKKYNYSISEIEDKIYCVVWDIIPLEFFKKAKCDIPYKNRLDTLHSFLDNNISSISITEYKYVNSYSEAIAHFKELLDRGEEGSVLKSLDGFWKDGKPNTQIKIKLEMEVDLKIVGFNSGKPKTKYENTLGSLEMESEDGLLHTNMSGISDSDRNDLWKNQNYYLGKIVVVKCNGVSTNREGGTSLLFPAFQFIRNDKLEANTLKEIKEIENMKILLGG